MGELNYKKSNSLPIIAMRNSRGRLFVYIGAIGAVCFVVFMLSNSHSSIRKLEGISEQCHQQRDSLSAQLQVVYEHKNRLEKSLIQEKQDHTHTREAKEKQISDLESKFQMEKGGREKLSSEISELRLKNSQLEEEKAQLENALKQQLKTQQSQKDAEIEKLHNHIEDLLSEKDRLDNANNAFTWKLEQHANEANLCKAQLEQAQKELGECRGGHQQNSPAMNNFSSHLLPLANPLTVDRRGNEVGAEAQWGKGDHLPVGGGRSVGDEIKPTNASSQPRDPNVLKRPALQNNNHISEGVLPQPIDPPLAKEGAKQPDLDAAIEQMDPNNNGAVKNVAPKKESVLQMPALQKDVEERDDHAGERGEDGIQYANPDAMKQQLDVPDYKAVAPKPRAANENDIEAQMQDMMNKSPGEVHNNNNNVEADSVLKILPHNNNNGAIDNKIEELRHGFGQRGDRRNGLEDKNNYEDDHEDRENDDEPVNGEIPMRKQHGGMADNDFDDQDNVDNVKEVEGVAVAPK